MKILFLIDEYYPLSQPTSKCLKQLLNGIDNDFVCDILTGGRETKVTQESNQTIYQINNLNKKQTSLFEEFSRIKFKFFYKLISIFQPPSLYKERLFYRKALKLCKANQYNLIVAVSGSFWTQRCALKLYNKKNINFCSYYTDPFIYNLAHRKFRLKTLKRIESGWIKYSSIIFMPGNYIDTYKSNYPNFLNKFYVCELPCYFDQNELKIINGTPKCDDNLIFHNGAIYSRIKNTKFLEKLIRINDDFKFKFIEDKTIRSMRNKLNNIVLTERKTGNAYLESIRDSKYLLVIDNECGIQIPSKLFESISTKKPIIFFYSNKESKALQIIKNIPGVQLINTDESSNYKITLNCTNYSRQTINNMDLLKPVLNYLNANCR